MSKELSYHAWVRIGGMMLQKERKSQVSVRCQLGTQVLTLRQWVLTCRQIETGQRLLQLPRAVLVKSQEIGKGPRLEL